MKKLLLIFFVLFQVSFVFSQNKFPSVTQNEKQLIIDSIEVILNRSYIYSETAKEMSDLVKDKFKKGDYNSVDNPMMLSEMLTKDLRSVCKDKHLAVLFNPEGIRAQRENLTDDDMKILEERLKRLQAYDNYGFKETKIFPGGIGYLKFNGFQTSKEAYTAATAAMDFLSHCSAFIIDLRENGGGEPEMQKFLSSYFFDKEVQLSSIYDREDDTTMQYWTTPNDYSKQLSKADVYLLTSNFTFSCAEAFAYDLKNLNRVTIVGETTGGGAHPVKRQIMNDNFIITVPFARAINPVSKSNWEGAGVEPDIKVNRDKALETALQTAYNKLLDNETNEFFRSMYQWQIEGLTLKTNPVKPDENLLKSYAGNFGPRAITFENGNLYYQREGRPKYKLIPISNDYFALDGMDVFRIKFLTEGNSVSAIEGHYDNGTIDLNHINK